MGTILDSFYDVGIFFCVIDKLNTPVRVLMDCVPKCFRCKFEMPSGPEGVFCLADGISNHLCCEWWRHVVFWGIACRSLSMCLS